MHRFRRRAASRRAVDTTSHQTAYLCELLEQRTLLTTTDPVIVLTERLSLERWPTVDSSTGKNKGDTAT